MDRVILHSDLNNFFASVECMLRPELKKVPVAVCGSIEVRHGIVLAKNELAKRCGVKTGETVGAAKGKCPELVTVEPHNDLYIKYSRLVRELYGDYTDRIESFGIDECWLDVTGSENLFGDGKTIADEIRARIRAEFGITASVGVSYNKVFAKMGSDYKKPDATTVITRENFRSLLWPLPVNDLLFVGPSTFKKLKLFGIKSIGDLACADYGLIETMLGANGCMLWRFANGLDMSPVCRADCSYEIKSIGNATTSPRDLVSDDDVRITLYVLCESVASRLRADGFRCRTVQLYVRDNKLVSFVRQCKVANPTCTEEELFEPAYALYKRNCVPGHPIRTLGVRASDLLPLGHEQLSFFTDPLSLRRESLDAALDALRQRYGNSVVRRGVLMTDPVLSSFCPRDENVIHPEKFARA